MTYACRRRVLYDMTIRHLLHLGLDASLVPLLQEEGLVVDKARWQVGVLNRLLVGSKVLVGTLLNQRRLTLGASTSESGGCDDLVDVGDSL